MAGVKGWSRGYRVEGGEVGGRLLFACGPDSFGGGSSHKALGGAEISDGVRTSGSAGLLFDYSGTQYGGGVWLRSGK